MFYEVITRDTDSEEFRVFYFSSRSYLGYLKTAIREKEELVQISQISTQIFEEATGGRESGIRGPATLGYYYGPSNSLKLFEEGGAEFTRKELPIPPLRARALLLGEEEKGYTPATYYLFLRREGETEAGKLILHRLAEYLGDPSENAIEESGELDPLPFPFSIDGELIEPTSEGRDEFAEILEEKYLEATAGETSRFLTVFFKDLASDLITGV